MIVRARPYRREEGREGAEWPANIIATTQALAEGYFKRKKNEKSRKTASASAERRREGGEAKWAAGAGAG